MKRIVSAGLLLTFLTVLLCGCQPTPEEPIVVNKKDDVLEQIIAEEPPAEKSDEAAQKTDIDAAGNLQVAEHYTDAITEDYAELTIDADILAPAGGQIPVCRVKPVLADEEMTKKFTDYFVRQGAEVTVGVTDGLKPATKSELEATLLSIKKSIIEFQNGRQLDPDEEGTVEERIAKLEQSALEYEERIRNYEEPTDPENGGEMDYSLKKDYFGEGSSDEEAYYVVTTADGTKGQLRIANNMEDGVPYCNVSYIRVSEMGCIGKSVGTNAAKEVAEAFLREMDLGAYELQLAVEYPEFTALTYSRTMYGIPLTYAFYVGDSEAVKEDEPYSFVLQQENIVLNIDDMGIASVEWTTPLEVTATENENVTVKTIEEIKEIGKKNLMFGIAPFPLYKQFITIKEIKLGYMAVPVRDDIGNYRLIPVWDFMGTNEHDNSGCYLTVNAIDGSVINRNLGY